MHHGEGLTMIRIAHRIGALVGAGVLLASLAACTSEQPVATPTASGGATGTLTVYAAYQLEGTFTDLGKQFALANPGSKVEFKFGPSAELAADIVGGAEADVFASSDVPTMVTVADPGLVDGLPEDFATNELAIAVAPGNPFDIAFFEDLANPDIKSVVCADTDPCGTSADLLEQSLAVTLNRVSEEPTSVDVLKKIADGEGDAGLVYLTDIASADRSIEGVEFVDSELATTTYAIASLTTSKNTTLSKAFVKFMNGATARGVLEEARFGAPS